MATTNLPTRTNTAVSDDEPRHQIDPTNTTELLIERLQAWRHLCSYLENFVSDTAKEEKTQAKDGEKILKSLSQPLKEGHHFDQALGGISGLLENLRANSKSQSDLHLQTSENLTRQILPMVERVHGEIKERSKELTSSAGKSSKAVEAARQASQKHIELLGQNTATFDSTGSRVDARHDPYVLQRGTLHRLNRQIMEENNNKADILNAQNSFQQFEAHIIMTVQAAMNSYNQFMSGQADRQKAIYGDIASTAQNIPQDFEWNGFVKRNGHILVSPNTPPRSMENVSFPNQGHRATKPLVEGTLERKHRGVGPIGGYSSGHYVVTPAGYLHEYKNTDNFEKDPTPEVSLYLPDCIVGALDGTKFAVKGKDSSGNKVSQKMSLSSEFNFKAQTPSDAETWHRVISSLAGSSSTSAPTSPVETRAAHDTYERQTANDEMGQQQGVIGRTEPAPTSTGAGHMNDGTGATAAGSVPITAGQHDNLTGTEHTNKHSEKKSGGVFSHFKRSKDKD